MKNFLKRKLPAAALALVMIAGMAPAAGAAKSDVRYSVEAGGEVSLDRRDFKDFFEDEYDDTFRYVTFDPGSSYKSSNGYIYYLYDKDDEERFSKNSLSDQKFYYSSERYGDYPLKDLSFVADEDADGGTVTLDFTAYGDEEELDGVLTIEIKTADNEKGDIVYKVEPGGAVSFDRRDFKDFFEDEYDDTLRYITFDPGSSYKSSNGYVYSDYDGDDEERFSKDDLEDGEFYYSSDEYGDYSLKSLSFVADKDADGTTVTLDFTAHGDDEDLDGTVVIRIGDAGGDDEKGDVAYETEPGGTVELDRKDFKDFFEEEYDDDTLRYVTFEAEKSYKSSSGIIYSDYEGRDEESFEGDEIEDYDFYYSSDEYGDYSLKGLSFVADKDADSGTVTLRFRAHGDDDYRDGTLTIRIGGSGGVKAGDVRYYAAYGSTVQINQNDIARYFNKTYPNSTLSYVRLNGVPSTGSLYYDYYGVSRYGTAKTRLTASNCGDQSFYFSPGSTDQYALSELSYLPSGVNVCESVPFTAYGSGGRSVKGTILISVTSRTVAEVYGATPAGTSVNLPASSIYSAVASATGKALTGIRLLELPDASAGTLYAGSGTGEKAEAGEDYGYAAGSLRMSQLRFVPAAGFTGSVEIPYAAYDGSGQAFAAGKVSLGVVNAVKRFNDVDSSTWCYKYVVELADAGIIDGYGDGGFKPDATVTYGQALKLIMLAAGYPEQAPTGSNIFSGYLAKAQADGLVSGSVSLGKAVTRQQVAQLAAKALRLDTASVSSVKPFTDTSDVFVQALYEAGIVEGYFSGGTSTFKPNNTLTRGQAAAIVWRMEQYAAS